MSKIAALAVSIRKVYGELRILLAHVRRRVFRGPLVETAEHLPSGGKLWRYRSGYVELHEPNGRVTDIALDLFFSQFSERDWWIMTYGGGARILLSGMTREEAMRAAADQIGPVHFVDDEQGFIFCRPASFAGGQYNAQSFPRAS